MNAAPHRRGFYLLVLLVLLLSAASSVEAQGRGDIAALVDKAKTGAIDEVRTLLPGLKKSHPDKAGVLFLEAVTESDAERAVELFQRIADEYRSSAWADDALYRLYQYSFAVGAYRTARSYTERIAAEHPKSPFLTRDQKDASGTSSSDVKSSPVPKSTTTASTTGAVKPRTDAQAANGVSQSGASPGGASQSYAVQVGAFSRQADAEKLAAELKEKGYTAYLREKTVSGKTVQAVWLGIFPDFTQAQAFASKLKDQQKIDAIVVRR